MPKVMLCFQEVQNPEGTWCELQNKDACVSDCALWECCGACTPLKRQAPRAAVSAARNTAALTAVGNSSLVAAGMTNF